jgi:hypothetical protein
MRSQRRIQPRKKRKRKGRIRGDTRTRRGKMMKLPLKVLQRVQWHIYSHQSRAQYQRNTPTTNEEKVKRT